MILISHRGNTNGPIQERENCPDYIDETLAQGYDVEIDLWVIDEVYLGHDEPQYKITSEWLYQRMDRLWVHCKNIKAIEYINTLSDIQNLNYFWHEEDTVTLTSKKYIWAYPGKQPIMGSIAVMPEIYKDTISNCIGICSDYIQNYK